MPLTRPKAHQLSGQSAKTAVRAVSTTNITLSGGTPATVDGVSLSLEDRVLVTGQSSGAENGIYRVTTVGSGSNGTWVRGRDSNQNDKVVAVMTTMVAEGTTYGDTLWKLITDGTITLGTTSLTFEQHSTVGSSSVDALADVTLSSTSTNDVLTYNGSQWVNSSAINLTGNIDGGNVNVDDTLRIAQTGSGLRMTNVGAFDNDGSDNFRIFATNDLIISANGENGTAITIDATNQDVAVTNDLTVSGDLDLDDADSVFIHGDTGYINKRYVLYGTTTDATTTEIFVGATSNSRVAVPTNTTMFYTVDIVARRTDATGESAGWQLKGVADNFSGTTADVGDVYEVAVARDDTNWEVDVLAGDTEDAIVVTVTGAASKTVKWMAVVKTMEITN